MRDHPNSTSQESPSSTLNSITSAPKPPTPTSSPPTLRRSRSSSFSSELIIVRQNLDMDSSDSDIECHLENETVHEMHLNRRHTNDGTTSQQSIVDDKDISSSGPPKKPTVVDKRGDRSSKCQSKIIRRTASLREPIIEKFGTFFSTLKQRTAKSTSPAPAKTTTDLRHQNIRLEEKLTSLKKTQEVETQPGAGSASQCERNELPTPNIINDRFPKTTDTAYVQDEAESVSANKTVAKADDMHFTDGHIPFLAYSSSSKDGKKDSQSKDSDQCKIQYNVPRSGVIVPNALYSPNIGPKKSQNDEAPQTSPVEHRTKESGAASTELLPSRESPPFDKERKSSTPCLDGAKKFGGQEFFSRSPFPRNRAGSFRAIVLPDKTNLRKQKACSSECLVMGANDTPSTSPSHFARRREGSQENIDHVTRTPRPPLGKKPTTDSDESSDPEAVSRGVLPPRPHSTFRKATGLKPSAPVCIQSPMNHFSLRVRDNSPSKVCDDATPLRNHDDTDEFDSLQEDNPSDAESSPKNRSAVPLIMTPAARIARNPGVSNSPPKIVHFNPHLDVVNIESQAGERTRVHRSRRHHTSPRQRRERSKECSPESSRTLSKADSSNEQSSHQAKIHPSSQNHIVQHEGFLRQSTDLLRDQMQLLEKLKDGSITSDVYKEAMISILTLQENNAKKLGDLFKQSD